MDPTCLDFQVPKFRISRSRNSGFPNFQKLRFSDFKSGRAGGRAKGRVDGRWAGERGGAWVARGSVGACQALRNAGRVHTCVAGVLGRALLGCGPGSTPSSLETKVVSDADVFGVCLVQQVQLLGGGTGVSASDIGEQR